MDSETKISNIRISGDSVFPDTNTVFFNGEDATLRELLDARVPFGLDNKIDIEHLPDTLIAERGFSGAKLAAISNTVITKKDTYQYVPFDQKVYEYGSYVGNQKSPPGGYKFCVPDDALYGVGLEFKFTHSPTESVSLLKIALKVEKTDGDIYNFSLFENNDVQAGSVELIATGVKELMLESGDCLSLVVTQDQLGGRIEGSFATQLTIHKVVRVPENFQENAASGVGSGGPGTIIDCEDVRDCFWCPDGVTEVVNDLQVTAPNGYTGQPSHSIALEIDSRNCTASLAGVLELPQPAFPAECDSEAFVSCISKANASPEDLGITFSQEQIMAIVGGFTTLTQFNALLNRVDILEDNCCD